LRRWWIRTALVALWYIMMGACLKKAGKTPQCENTGKMRTPPGISPTTFAVALQEFSAAIGKDWVFTSDEDLDLYRDSYSPLKGAPEERTASAAVAPKTAEEVQAIVRIANRHSIPLYAISTGKNLGYGGSAPAYSGSVVVDLKRMNRIIEVNDRNHYAIVEPGVSYFDLYNYIQEHKLKVWIDCPDPGWGSPIGNALDHGVGSTAGRFRNHFDAHCGMEVVLANGEIMRTGMGALPNAKTWPEFKNGFGPIIDGLFSQSNFGIVTKMGFWLMPEPEAYLEAKIHAFRYDDLNKLVETLNYLENSGITTGLPEISSALLGAPATYGQIKLFRDGAPPMEEEHSKLLAEAKVGYSPALERYGIDHGLPYWTLNLGFYGPAKVVAAQWEAVQDIAGKAITGLKFEGGPAMTFPLSEAQAADVHLPHIGIPNLEIFVFGARSPGNPTPSAGHLWYTPVIPRTGDAILEANRVFSEVLAKTELPVAELSRFVMPFCLYERSFLFVVGFPVTEDLELNARYVEALREFVRVGAERGWGEYRTPVILQDQVMGIYSFNDNILRRFHETLKDAVDPKGILSPGRYGIWPKHLRPARQ
jgi:4-cresol dehydrogenase (hydroxylating)